MIFQSTLPYGSDISTVRQSTTDNNFNPRSLTGATPTKPPIEPTIEISIHAPLRERLAENQLTIICFDISIHAPLRERLMKQLCKCSLASYFNPRSLTGATVRRPGVFIKLTISIHAPLRERLSLRLALQVLYLDFNPRSLTGATTRCWKDIRLIGYFNPRSLTGATQIDAGTVYNAYISIHAPLRERLYPANASRLCIFISIHAPLRERQF